MDTVMKYVFWVVLAAILVVALGAWVTSVPGLRSETQGWLDEARNKSKQISEAATKKDAILTQRHVEAAQKYGKHLKAQEAELLEQWKDKGPRKSSKFENAPQSLLQFDGWTSDLGKEIQAEAQQAEMTLPSDFGKKFLFEGVTTSDATQREERIRKLSLIAELVHILASTKAPVTRYKFNPKLGLNEVAETLPAGIVSLDQLDILWDSAVQAGREREILVKAMVLAGAPSLSGAEDTTPRPYSAQTVVLQFTAPFPVIAPVVQALESHPGYFAVVRKVDTQRVAPTYPAGSDFPRLAPATLATPGAAKVVRANTRYEEAPVQAVVALDLLTFNLEMAKKQGETPKAPPPKKN